LKRRVVITGLGTVNPLGNGVKDAWAGICAGKSGIGMITKFNTDGFSTKIAGEVKGFDSQAFMSAKEARRLDDFIIYALASTAMALEDAGLVINAAGAERTGVIIGSGIGGLVTMEKAKETLTQQGPRRLSPFTIPAVLANLAAGQVSIRFGAKGPVSCTVTACSSGANAIGDSFRLIAGGYADAMITGGTEAAVCPLTVAGFNAMRALSTRNDAPEKASRPFDRDRDGFVIGEGCGILILEELSSALKRGARIYAEISGLGVTSDAFHIAAPPPGHEGAARCMRLALQEAGLGADDIDYINSHGTSTPLNDLYEVQAIKQVFGERARSLAVSSTKSMTGHLLGAAGGLEAVITAKAIEEGVLPPTINLENPDEGCDLDFVPHVSRKKEIRAALSSAFGFGGVNAVLVFRKFEN
jgi:3-oxoacyl-[acyl-carrier-protein] synthase II